MNTTPKVSVLMPAYNCENYISEAINSILTQTFTNFEFIIINDGSTDNTSKIIKTFNDPRIKFIDNSINKGLISVLNQGIDICKGEYIARMDSDDISMKDRLKKQVEYLDRNLEVGILGTNCICFGDGTGVIEQFESVKIVDLLTGCKVAHPTVMIRKNILDKFNLRYNPNFTACEDYELWVNCVQYTKIKNLPEYLLKYRIHKQSISSIMRKKQLENDIKVQQKILDILSDDIKNRTNLEFLFSKMEKSRIVYLFKFIPLLRIKSKSNKVKYFLFLIIPILKIKDGIWYLFNFIPIAKNGSIKNT